MRKLQRYNISPCGIKPKGLLGKDVYEADQVDSELEANQIAYKALSALLPRWVSVDEPPKKDGMYLCIVNEYEFSDVPIRRYRTMVKYTKSKYDFDTSSGWTTMDEVTHYLSHIPPTPKKKET